MKIKITRKINEVGFEFVVENADDFETLFAAAAFSSMPTKCKCGSPDITLSANQAKEYRFVKMICKTCGMRAQLGQYKKGGMFWKEWEKYSPENQGGEVPTIDAENPQEF